MLTLFAIPYLPTSAGSANSCSRPSVLKVAVAAAAAKLLRLAGESAGGVMPLSGNDKETLAVLQTAGPGGGAQDGAVLHF
jgi:hypothetical protein